MYAFLMILITILIYCIGVAIRVTNRWSTPQQINSEVKIIPADIVLLTVPINIGNSLNPGSAFRLLGETYQLYLLISLVLISLIVYTVLLCYGKILHKRNQSEPFCGNNPTDAKKLNGCYGVAIVFLLFATLIASL